jgi:hypothetical protein
MCVGSRQGERERERKKLLLLLPKEFRERKLKISKKMLNIYSN